MKRLVEILLAPLDEHFWLALPLALAIAIILILFLKYLGPYLWPLLK